MKLAHCNQVRNRDNKLRPLDLSHVLEDAEVQISNILQFVDMTNCNVSFYISQTTDLLVRTSI